MSELNSASNMNLNLDQSTKVSQSFAVSNCSLDSFSRSISDFWLLSILNWDANSRQFHNPTVNGHRLLFQDLICLFSLSIESALPNLTRQVQEWTSKPLTVHQCLDNFYNIHSQVSQPSIFNLFACLLNSSKQFQTRPQLTLISFVAPNSMKPWKIMALLLRFCSIFA